MSTATQTHPKKFLVTSKRAYVTDATLKEEVLDTFGKKALIVNTISQDDKGIWHITSKNKSKKIHPIQKTVHVTYGSRGIATRGKKQPSLFDE
jgi:hypothetical protein